MKDLIKEVKEPAATATMLERLQYLLELSHRTQAQFARVLNIDPSSMSKILAGKMPITEQFVNRVVVNAGVSKEWFVRGEGTPFAKGQQASAEITSPVVIREVPKGAPVYEFDAAAGFLPQGMQFSRDKIIGYIDMPDVNPDNPVIKVSGDSMEPRIPNGSLISIRPVTDTSIIVWGYTYVVQLDDYCLVKVVRPCHSHPERIVLHSENPAYDDIELNRSAIRRLFVVETVLNYRNLA